MEQSKASEAIQAGLVANRQAVNGMSAGGVFTVECRAPDGRLKWTDSFHNLVVNEGLQDMNTQYFKGSAYTAAWYLGLVEGPGGSNTYAASDTLASHAGWTENSDYSGNRKAVVFGTASTADPSVISNTASPSSFAMSATATIGGAFLTNATSGTSGVLFSVGSFTGGDKLVDNGDTLNVTYQFSLDAA
jgi:hypothetical protein